jgi:hypothetical protein
MGSSAEVSSAAHLPEGMAVLVDRGALGSPAATCCDWRVSRRRSPIGWRFSKDC